MGNVKGLVHIKLLFFSKEHYERALDVLLGKVKQELDKEDVNKNNPGAINPNTLESDTTAEEMAKRAALKALGLSLGTLAEERSPDRSVDISVNYQLKEDRGKTQEENKPKLPGDGITVLLANKLLGRIIEEKVPETPLKGPADQENQKKLESKETSAKKK